MALTGRKADRLRAPSGAADDPVWTICGQKARLIRSSRLLPLEWRNRQLGIDALPALRPALARSEPSVNIRQAWNFRRTRHPEPSRGRLVPQARPPGIR